MDKEQIAIFTTTHANKFDALQMQQIGQMLEKADDVKGEMALAQDYKDPTMILVIAFIVGGLGVDRFMLGETGLGVAKLLTVGGCGIWSIADLFTAQKRAKEYNFKLVQKVLM